MKNKTLRNDILIVVFIIILSFIIGFLPFLSSEKGKTFSVSYPDFYAEYNINENRTIVLDFTTIVVENGEIFVKDSDCPDKVCEHFGRISKAGESIVCVPNELVIKISGDMGVDSVVE